MTFDMIAQFSIMNIGNVGYCEPKTENHESPDNPVFWRMCKVSSIALMAGFCAFGLRNGVNLLKCHTE